jgi:putative ABC transport system permease protein
MAFLSAIERKLVRELGRLKGQIVTIALVLAGGITCFICLRGTYNSLDASRTRYYDRYRFAHVFAHLERAPLSSERQLQLISGVAEVETRITKEVALPLEGMDRPAYARLISLPRFGMPSLNALHLSSGRLPDHAQPDEVCLLQSFADAQGFAVGSHFPAVINGKLRNLTVAGIVSSPEYVYALRPGALVEDPRGYAVIWMGESSLGSAFQLEGAFNDVTARLQPGASEPAVLAAFDRILGPYGGLGAIGRKDQVSNRILTGELSQLEALAGMVPIVFLAVAGFLMNMVLQRLIRLQRPEIATLKAVGYSNREVGFHYLGLVAVVLVPGAVLGVVGGILLGRVVLNLYADLFRFPDLIFEGSVSLIAASLLVSLVAAVAGALVAVRSAIKLPPAEAMRAPAPARYRPGIFDRLGLGVLAGPSGKMVLREIQRRPFHTLLSSVGIGGAIALMILGRFGTDSLNEYLDSTYRREQRQDLSVLFSQPVEPRVIGELERLPGVITAEGVRSVPIRVKHGQHKRESVLLGLARAASLRRLVERGGGHAVEVPDDGVLVTKALGKILEIGIGDRLDLEVREGKWPSVRPVVIGFVDESVGLQIYAQSSLVSELEGDMGAISSALLRVEPSMLQAVERHLRRSPYVVDVSDIREDVQRLRDMNASMIDVWTLVSITLSACLIFGVVYNNARIALAARERDLASLRVLGFERGEISAVLIGGLAIEVALAIPLGLVLGRAWAERFMANVDQEMFRWQVVVEPRTYLIAAAVAVLAGLGSALLVRRKLDHLDLIGVLKTRE